MRVVVLMARVTACQRRYLKDRFDVAVNTCNVLMPAQKSVFCVPAVVKECFSPGRAAMAGVALIAVTAIVFVVFEVTGHAGRIHLVFKGVG